MSYSEALVSPHSNDNDIVKISNNSNLEFKPIYFINQVISDVEDYHCLKSELGNNQ